MHTATIRIVLLACALVASCQPVVTKRSDADIRDRNFATYSKNVADSFFISVSLPSDYDAGQKKQYPVVYLLDANFYFDMMAPAINNYADVGLIPPVILVGIGYRDFGTMDSLRDRDYTFPAALPEYEMSVSGGADKFLSFISHELIPEIERRFSCDTASRVLMGHSLGGYFVTYSLLQQLAGKQRSFHRFIAASPSLHYSHYYLLNRFADLPIPNKADPKSIIFATAGELEDEEDAGDTSLGGTVQTFNQLSGLLADRQSAVVTFKSEVYSNLGHMYTPIPSFLKGIQAVLIDKKPK